ncbi:MAG: twin-arginine translocase TatA/TatE family subunit, partial [Thermodesulfobacteriota bacterium]
MLDIGLSELLIIMAVALIVLGPKKLPEVARSLGRGLAQFRRASEDLRRSILVEDDPVERDRSTEALPYS